ncbi:MAG: hypothetical protein ACKVT1_12775 [Dehalococcoidia bacterium]
MVTANLWLPGTGFRADVHFIVDITLPRTSLSSFAVAQAGAAAMAAEAEERAILTIDHEEGGRSGFFLVHVTDADYSRLGRDVLERTIMVYDPRGRNLLVEVVDADL